MQSENLGPKILLLDIETAPIIAHVWSLWDQNVSLNQIKSDWHLLSWSAKWLSDPPSKIMYKDQRGKKNLSNDKELLQGIWKLLDEADIVVTQNGKAFDIKKLNARFLIHGFRPPSSFRQIDTKIIASRIAEFTSNKLAYLTDKLCKKYKKLEHKEFPGFEMWEECLKDNIHAWKAMEKYNKYDVLSLEELYLKLIPWDNSINFNVYHDKEENKCTCGSSRRVKKGFSYTNTSKFQRFICQDCGSQTRGSVNLLDKSKRKSLLRSA